jgi:acetylornithine/succinyldiaminopimelate/putrescine aminotransferase
MGNGMPIGACWAPVEIAASFQPGDHGSTYSGTALATAAVNAVIDEMRRLDAPALAATKGQRLRSVLTGIEGITGVRGSGLLIGVALADGLVAGEVAAAALSLGLIVNAVNASTIRLAPPLTVSDDEIVEAVGILAAAIKEVRS